jgi:ADP-ribose pyrophosphatase
VSGDFEHLRDELIHQGHVVGLYNSYFTTPDGEEMRRDVVKHPGAVSAVAIEDGGVWLVKQFRAPIRTDMWEIPAGKLDVAGEPLEATVVRELEEEIGRHPGSVEQLIALHHSPGFCDEFQTVFLCTDLTEVPTNHDGPEEAHMIVQRFPLETALTMALDGSITDAKTIIGLLAAARRLGL